MISADFYPTTYDLTNPVRQLTDNIEYNPNGTATDIELSNAYWLGWMKWETVPDCWKFSTYTQTADSIVIDFVTPSQNVNVGYLARRYTSAQTGRRWSNMYRRSDDTVSMYSVGYPNQYLNKYDIMGCAPIRQFWVQIFAACEYKTSSSATTYINSGIQLGSRYVDEYLSFFNGDSTLDFSLNVGSVGSVSISLDINNIEEDNTFIIEGTQGGYDYKIKAYFAFVCTNTAPDVTPSGNYVTGATATNIIPMIGVTIGDDYYLLCGDTSHFTQILGQIQIQVLANYVFNPNQMFNNMLVGGYKAEIDKNVFNSMAVNNTYFSGNTAFVKTASGNSGILNRVLSPQEIMTIIGIMPRVGRGYDTTNIANYGYTENVIWATYVTEDNEFTATLITGNLSDDEFKAKLRPWQYDVDEWSENDYTEEDLPPYEPEGDDNPTTSGGDDHLPRRGFSIGGTGGFVTQYALSYSQLHEFANMLWAQFGDADFISNIGTTFLNDYSIKPSDILNYIVSMRVYPFNLADSVSYTDTQSANIFIGRGVFPYILTTGNTHVIADTCETFDGGYCDVPTYYNDFRDYEPASSIEVYVPYCGSVSIAPSEVVGKRLRLTYGVDYSTGALSATLWVISDTNYTLAVLSGQVAASIQMSASNEMDGILRLTSIATTIGKAMLTEDKIDASKMSDTAKHVSNATNALGMASDLVNSVGSGLPVHSIGNTNGFSNFATPPRACITISYHKYKNPQNFAHVYGYKCNRRETLSSLNGYTKCKNVDVSGFTCHEDERTEIKALLESGVYL